MTRRTLRSILRAGDQQASSGKGLVAGVLVAAGGTAMQLAWGPTWLKIGSVIGLVLVVSMAVVTAELARRNRATRRRLQERGPK